MGNIWSYFFPEEEVYPHISLLDMPNEVIRMILGELWLREIQTLRKVCRGLRTFIDNSDLYTELMPNVKIVINSKSISFSFDGDRIKYIKNGNGCTVRFKKLPGTFLEDVDILEAAMMDFEPILKNPKTEFSFFAILTSEKGLRNQKNFKKFLIFLENVLKSRPRPLRTKEILMDFVYQLDVLHILPHLQPGSLTKIGFRQMERAEKLRIDRVMKLEQWKKAKYVFSEKSPDLSTFHESFGHFETIELRFFDFPEDGWRIIKEAMILHPIIDFILIQFHSCNVASPFEDPYIDEENTNNWFFEISKSEEKYGKISQMPRLIIFERIELFEIPDGAFIQI